MGSPIIAVTGKHQDELLEEEFSWNLVNWQNLYPETNWTIYFMTIQDFIKKKLPLLSLDLNNVFAVCSYVPDKSAMDLVLETFPYYRVYYPGLISVWNRPPDEHESSLPESKRTLATVTDSGLCSTRARE